MKQLFIILFFIIFISCSDYDNKTFEFISFERNYSNVTRYGTVEYIFTYKIIDSKNNGKFITEWIYISPSDKELIDFYKSKIGKKIHINKIGLNDPMYIYYYFN
jgi:hypothetical protein